MLNPMIPTITNNEAPVPISISKNVCNNIFKPIKINKTPNPVFNRLNIFITLLNIQKSERSPIIANIFEKNTMYGSCVTEKIAGMESTANKISENSITNKTKKRVVM